MTDSHILLIETSCDLCSVALAKDGKIVSSKVSDTSRSHASLTAVFCDEVLKDNNLKARDLSAVAISAGPGSYTGLRVGTSTAKGLCFGAGIPLITVPTTEVLMNQWIITHRDSFKGEAPEYIIPMIDARRMEVYCSVFTLDGKEVSPMEAKIIDSASFKEIASKSVFIGDGAGKCSGVIDARAENFFDESPLADSILPSALTALDAKNFSDVAYFSPLYLKDFTPSEPKKKTIF